MNRLLIVDDEPIIVDGLYDLLSESFNMEVYTAYSAIEALKLLNKMKFDIVLTDLRMPKMSGLELLEEINQLWPQCKVIFLTGYSDFSYIQSVIQNGGYHYILKTDGDDEIVNTIHRAKSEITRQLEAESRLLKTEQMLRGAKHSLQKDFLVELTLGISKDVTILNEQFNHLEIPLSAENPIYVVLGLVVSSGLYESYSDQLLLMFAIQNITEEFISSTGFNFQCVAFDRTKLLIIVQPSSKFELGEEAWNNAKQLLEDALQSLQNVCADLYGSNISFALSDGPVSWGELGKTYNELRFLLLRGLNDNGEMLLTVNNNKDHGASDYHSLYTIIRKINTLRLFNLNCKDDEFIATFRELINELNEHRHIHSNLKLEVYYTLTCLFLNLINRWNIGEINHSEIDIMKLIQIQNHDTWEKAMNYFTNLAEMIIELKQTEQHERRNDVITKVHEYVEDNMSEGLSLNGIAGSVHLNPQYLSRLYRQVTGSTLSDYITEIRINKAKDMLMNTPLKIHEIATAQGFESSAYFTRFFKRNTNLTPQEFRKAGN